MSDTGSDIIIKGGSVELSYDEAIYEKGLVGDPKVRKNQTKKIIQVIVSDADDEILYDSGEHSEGLKFTIKARCK